MKEENQQYMEEIDELQLKVKSKKTKIKAFKKQISESEDQKEVHKVYIPSHKIHF